MGEPRLLCFNRFRQLPTLKLKFFVQTVEGEKVSIAFVSYPLLNMRKKHLSYFKINLGFNHFHQLPTFKPKGKAQTEHNFVSITFVSYPVSNCQSFSDKSFQNSQQLKQLSESLSHLKETQLISILYDEDDVSITFISYPLSNIERLFRIQGYRVSIAFVSYPV